MARGRRGDRGGRGRRAVGAWQPIDPDEDEHAPPAVATGPMNVESYVAASLGPPRWLERLQDIEGEEFHLLGDLRRRWLGLAAGADWTPETFAAAWRAQAEDVDLTDLNRLIAQHNEYFPIERRLSFDLRLGDYRAPWGIPWRRDARDAAWIMDHLPPDLDRAGAELAHG